MTEPPSKSSLEVRRYNRRVWEMVLYQLHPAAIYVVLQVLIISWVGAHPAFARIEIPMYAVQFLGAWAIVYDVLLRESGFSSRAAPILCGMGLLAVVFQYLFLRPIQDMSDRTIWIFCGIPVLPTILVFTMTFLRYRRARREFVEEES